MITALKFFCANNAVEQVLGTMLGHFVTGMSIEHSKERPIVQTIAKTSSGIVCIFHFTAPTLHRANAEEQFVSLTAVIVLVRSRFIQERSHHVFSCCAQRCGVENEFPAAASVSLN